MIWRKGMGLAEKPFGWGAQPELCQGNRHVDQSLRSFWLLFVCLLEIVDSLPVLILLNKGKPCVVELPVEVRACCLRGN